MNKLYFLHNNIDENNENYGINYIYNVPCIYTVIEPDIIKQIINMRKFRFELLQIKDNEVMNLFGINSDIEDPSFIYNNTLISISLSNSTITEEKNLDELEFDENVNKRNIDILQKEKFLINLSCELFSFDFITRQFDKSKLKQLPRMLFFCSVFDENMKDIYKLRKEKIEKKVNDIDNTKVKKEEKKNLNEKDKKKGQISTNQENRKGKKETKEKVKENIDKNLLKCQLLDFCGTLELDGAFKYIGENNIELNSDSLIIILSEFLNAENNIEKYLEKSEENKIINTIKKNQNDIEKLKKILPNKFNMFKNIQINYQSIENIKQEFENKPKIIFDKRIIVKSNDIVLIESKREFPKHLINEIKNFIEHSFYFITLYKNKKILENSSIIHLIFIYDHTRNYEDEYSAYSGLNDIIKDNSAKLKIFRNKIKFYLVHSLPNLNLSILDNLENNISYLTNLMEKQNKQISNLESENNNLKNLMNKQNKQISNLESENNNLKNLMDEQKNLMNEQNKTIKNLINRIDELENEMKQNKNSDDKKKNDENKKKNDENKKKNDENKKKEENK